MGIQFLHASGFWLGFKPALQLAVTSLVTFEVVKRCIRRLGSL